MCVCVVGVLGNQLKSPGKSLCVCVLYLMTFFDSLSVFIIPLRYIFIGELS